MSEETETIDVVLCDKAHSLSNIPEYVTYGGYEGIELNFHLRNDTWVEEEQKPYLLNEAPENAIVYAHSSIAIGNNAFFSMALEVSKQRPDLRFILRMRDAHYVFNFKNPTDFKAYQELAEHNPSPSMPISVADHTITEFFITPYNFKHNFERYVREYIQMRRTTE